MLLICCAFVVALERREGKKPHALRTGDLPVVTLVSTRARRVLP